MQTRIIAQCSKSLDFRPLMEWPKALPAYCWRGEMLAGFGRENGLAFDLFEGQRANLTEAVTAIYPSLTLSELARFAAVLAKTWPETFLEIREPLFQAYGLRWSERLGQTLEILAATPAEFQDWVSQKDLGARDLNVLLALPEPAAFHPFLQALSALGFSKSEGVRALELGAELFLMEKPLSDLLPAGDKPAAYLKQLEQWRRPNSTGQDEAWRESVRTWPWPAQTQGRWQRFGDESGIEVNIRSTSPQDFAKKLERLSSIGEAWKNNP